MKIYILIKEGEYSDQGYTILKSFCNMKDLDSFVKKEYLGFIDDEFGGYIKKTPCKNFYTTEYLVVETVELVPKMLS